MPFARISRALLAALALAAAPAAAQTPPVIRVAVLEFGTVNWEMEVIKRHGLDAANGFTLETMGVAGNPAAAIAFQGGEADAMVSDWIWVSRQRADGRDFVFLPYSKAVGGLLARPETGVGSLTDLKGRKIGVAGGPLDKSWLVLRAFARQQYGFDLADEAEAVFGAPPLIQQKAIQGELDAVLTFWNFAAKLETKGFQVVASTAEASQALGLDPDTPLLGYVLRGDWTRAHPELAEGLARASRAAKQILLTDDAEWDLLRPSMKAEDDADFAALKQGFRAGVPDAAPVDEAAAARMFALMARIGGAELVGGSTELSDGVFYQPRE